VAPQPHLWEHFGASEDVLPYDGTATLWPQFISDPDDVFQLLLRGIDWEDHYITLFGRPVREPRQSVWFHTDGLAYRYSQSERTARQFTPLLTDIMKQCADIAEASFNSVLANLYRTGEDSMGWHADDEPELGREPVIASISLGAERRFDFRHRDSGDTASVVLPHGSLLVMRGQSQHKWVHRIARTKKVTSPRVNLTFRLTQSDM
jgi:alkylated DNA repair dioxygenase AlkB